MKTKNYYIAAEKLLAEQLNTLEIAREEIYLQTKSLVDKREAFYDTLPSADTFMRGAEETEFDDEIARLSAIGCSLNKAFNDAEFLIKNPETAEPDYDGYPC
jgi:hypothetical protein